MRRLEKLRERCFSMRRIVALLMGIWAIGAMADIVHVTYQTSAGGTVATLAERTMATGCSYTTVPAPMKDGFIFTHWSSSESDPLVVRDAFGRALDAARFTLYQDVTLTAHYRPVSEDADGDGVPDGWEFYWYGNLAQDAASDTDGDGYTFAEELARGTNPLFPDTTAAGGVSRVDSESFLYNPHGYAPVIVRSEPVGVLVTSSTNYLATGELWRTPALAVSDGFAYWTVDGVAQRDAFGRALDQVVVNPDATRVTEVVAHVVTDAAARQALYWYGRTDVSPDSDTDGDGYTFAEELANGTNPLFPDTTAAGGVSRVDSESFLYNPHGSAPVIVRSEPVGALFAAATNYVAAGDFLRTPALAVSDGFAYWTVDGIAQRDAFGRALDQVVVSPDATRVTEVVAHVVTDEFARWSLYWYGRTDVSPDSDTDGDGYTFAEEIANGTNPLFPDTTAAGGVSWVDSVTVEANLQPFDPATGTVVGDVFEPLFTSPFAGNAATSRTFGPNARPVVTDVNGDGVFDLVILWDGGYEVYLNGGTAGNPTFTRAEGISTNGLDLAQGSLAVLDGLTLDVSPTDAVSCAFGDVDQDGIVDLLVSDADGRIWFYRGMGENVFALQHKVWGGSHAGFASGLTIALVDWDGDGDLDCVCGTADGKLMLLVDPRVGRPTNVQATAGADSVVLTWDPNGNSRVRGYGIYRGTDTNAYDVIESQWPLPRYRDVPEIVQDYYYRVTSLSRFYTTGNSLPTVSESSPTDAVYVQFRPRAWLTGTSGFTGSNITVVVSMDNSMGVSAEGLSLDFAYDPAVLEPRGMRTTGLTENVAFGMSGSNGAWRFAATGGAIATGAGRFLLLDFRIRPVHDITETTVTLTAAVVKALDGRAVSLDVPQSAKVEISDSNPLVPAVVAVRVADASVASETAFDLPVTVTSSERLTNFTAMVVWDAALLELRGATGATLVGGGTDGTARIRGAGGDCAMNFYARDPASSSTNFTAHVSLTDIAAVDAHGFSVGADDVAGVVLIRNAHPWVPATVRVGVGSAKADTLAEFDVPVMFTSSERLTNLTATVAWNADVLELRGIVGGATLTDAGTSGTARLSGDGGDFTLKFYAKDQHTTSRTDVRLSNMTVVDAHGFVVRAEDAKGIVLIRDSKPLVPAGVVLNVSTVSSDTLREFTVPIPVASTKVLTNLAFTVGWDASVLELHGASGGAFIDGAVGNGSARIGVRDTVPATLYLTFYAKDQHTVSETSVTLGAASAMCIDGLAANVTTVDGTVRLTDANVPVPVELTVATYNARVKSGEAFKVPIGATASGDLATLTVDVEWDDLLLSFGGCAAARIETVSANRRRLVFACEGNYSLFNLDFTAARIVGLQSNAWTRVIAASGVGRNGLAAVLKTELPRTGEVVIVREIGRYDPGDLDGDGAYTANDELILTGYISYLKMQKKGANFAKMFADGYLKQYGVDVRLAGAAARAADVNGDGQVTSSDIAMLQMLIAESEGAGK